MENFIEEKLKKSYITKGFLSSGENPTQNAVIMYSIYLLNLPEGWNEEIIYKPSVDKVRQHFGVEYGFENMIRWGIQFECSRSKTSSNRHISMNKAYLMAKANLSMGMFITNKKLVMN
jgi:predicted glycosyl hydrolase (DUF1957 family)